MWGVAFFVLGFGLFGCDPLMGYKTRFFRSRMASSRRGFLDGHMFGGGFGAITT